MFKKFIKNIIPLALLLHISSCSSFGVSKSEMDGACGIIDKTLETDSPNLKNIEGTIGGQESNIKNLVTGDNSAKNMFLLKKLKKDITAWGKKKFDEAVAECVIYRPNEEYRFLCPGENLRIIQKFDNNSFINDGSYLNYTPNDVINDVKECLLNKLKNKKGSFFAHIACARIIAVDLKDNKLSYRIKYLSFLFLSGQKRTLFTVASIENNFVKNPLNLLNLNKKKTIENKKELEKKLKFYNSLRFVEDYGFYGNFNDCQHGHLDSERALLLCLTEKAPNAEKKEDDKKLKAVFVEDTNEIQYDFANEESYKLANFVHPNTIDLCIQVRNQNPMCGNCQCFYVGIDKADLNSTGGLFLERGEPDDTSGFNILSILKRMEKYKKQEDVNHKENNYKNSLFLATRRGQEDTFFSGTKHQIGNKDYNPENIINGSLINTDQNASDDYEVAKGNFYSRSDYTQKIHIHKTNCKCIQCDKKNKKK